MSVCCHAQVASRSYGVHQYNPCDTLLSYDMAGSPELHHFCNWLGLVQHADGGRWHVRATRVHLAPDMAIEGQLSADNNKMKKGTN